MPTVDLILSGVNLMLLGMGIVFSFLVLLVFSMLGMSRFALIADRHHDTHAENKPILQSVHPSAGTRAELVAVISAAITRYRTTHR